MSKTIIPVASLPIRLGQFLKLANIVQDGLEAKILISSGNVIVNNSIELRRGRQLFSGDSIEISTGSVFIIAGKE